MPNFVFQRFEKTMVVVQTSKEPGDDEWQAYCDACVEMVNDLGGYEGTGALIFSDGGAPASRHRVQLGKILAGKTVPSAVVTDSLVVRTALGIFSLINPGIKVFPSRDWTKAAAFALVPPNKQLETLKVAVKLGRIAGDIKVLRAMGL